MTASKIIFLLLLVVYVWSQTYTVDLDRPPNQRYTQQTLEKKDSILAFIKYLKQSVPKFRYAFAIARVLNSKASRWFRHKVGSEFYAQCQSISVPLGIPVSDIVVFNYMYELGAAHKFCTAITVSSANSALFGRNLDYGFQEYLTNNSILNQYQSKGQILFETLGHAGFVGTHTALKRATADDSNQYAITLNERIHGGLRLTLAQMLATKCRPSPSAMIETIKKCKGDFDKVVSCLKKVNTCSTVYYTLIDSNGNSAVIEKNRGKRSHYVRGPEKLDGINYIIQTNHDAHDKDPDGRSTVATQKIKETILNNHEVKTSDLWQILIEKPNFNSLTLMTAVVDVKNGIIDHKIWNKPTQ